MKHFAYLAILAIQVSSLLVDPEAHKVREDSLVADKLASFYELV